MSMVASVRRTASCRIAHRSGSPVKPALQGLVVLAWFRIGGGRWSTPLPKAAWRGWRKPWPTNGPAAPDNIAPCADPVRHPAILPRIPAGRWGDPEDMAGAVAFLASGENPPFQPRRLQRLPAKVPRAGPGSRLGYRSEYRCRGSP